MKPLSLAWIVVLAGACYADAKLPPVALTGGFSESTCAKCHTGPVNPPGGRVTINPPPSYAPGATVPIQVTIQDTGGLRWGFELSSRFSNRTQAGKLESREPQSTVRSASGVQYALQVDAPIQQGGSYTFTVYWTAPPDNSGGEVIFNAVGMAANNDNGDQGDRTYAVEMRSSGAPPKVSAGGVVSAASFTPAPNNRLAPGQLISVFGTGLAPGGTVWAASVPLPVDLGTTRLRLGGVQDMPLLYVSPLQINAQLPFEALDSGVNQVTAFVNSLTSSAETVTLVPAAPALFTVNGQGTGLAAALHADYSALNAARPAIPGEIALLFGTGLGRTSPAARTGEAGKGEKVTAAVTITMDGKDAPVLFAGLAPSFVGLYQINAVVPQVKGTVEVLVFVGGVGGAQSPAGVTLQVQ